MHVEIIDCDLSRTDHAEAFVMLLNEYINDDMGKGEPILGKRKEKVLADLAANSSKLILFLRMNDLYVGMVVCFWGYSTFRVSPVLNIHDIIVLAKYRRKGFGRQLMEVVKERALKEGCEKITLEVRYDNEKARHLYMSLGYGECQPPMSFWVKLFPHQEVV